MSSKQVHQINFVVGTCTGNDKNDTSHTHTTTKDYNKYL